MWSGVEKFMFCGEDTRYRLEPTNVKQDRYQLVRHLGNKWAS